MNHNESRLKKIEEIIAPEKRTVVILHYGTAEPESWIEVNGIKHIIPLEADVDEFINEKSKHIRGVCVCILYLSKANSRK